MSDSYPDSNLAKSNTRRNFLKNSGKALAAGVAAGGLASHALAAENPGRPCWVSAMPSKWDESYDIVIVGSGFGGLSAAYEAKKVGATVAILEKMRTAGGNSMIIGGILAAAGSPLQQANGIKDSPELLEKDMIREGLGLNHPELVRLVAQNAWPSVKWTIDEFGVQYEPSLSQEGGHSVPRCYQLLGGGGEKLVPPMIAKLKSMGQEIKLQTYVQKILRDSDGRVKGLEVREGYVFPRVNSGKIKYIQAKRAVILAHGGFSADVLFRMLQDPKLTAAIDSTNQPGATAELLRESLRIGATPVQLDWIQVLPMASPDEKGFGVAPPFAGRAASMHGIWINTSTGKRFVSELANRKVRADAIMSLMNQGQKCVAIVDEANLYGYVKEVVVPKAMERGVIKAFNSWDELAAAYQIPLPALKETVANYNQYLSQGKDLEFDRYLNKNSKPLGTPPIYVQRLLPKVHYTMGGININEQAQVTDISSDKPIPGLYAAGEATGGVHGAVRLGSCSSVTCLVFGRIAGKMAAAEKPWT
jgi:flavocytochrome c